jgi:hypothetical protein
MNPARVQAAALLLSCAALAASCDRSPSQPAPAPAPAASHDRAATAGDSACALPLDQFAPHKLHLTGSRLDYPTNLLLIDRAGRLRWNGVSVGAQRLGEYIAAQAQIEPPPILVIEPERDAPCVVVREVLATAIRTGRCTPTRCAFQWPGDMAPPPPP